MKIQQIPQKLHWDIEVKGTPEDGIILLQTTNISTHHVHIEPASLPALAAAIGFSPEEIWKEACEACLAIVSEVSTAGSLSLERMTPPLPDKYLTPNPHTP